MKFSYSLLKKLVPAIKSKKDIIEKLSLFAFEAEDLPGNALEIKISPNRFSSAGGHWGIAQELLAIYRTSLKLRITDYELTKKQSATSNPQFKITINSDLCRRLTAQYISNIKIKTSPKWLQSILQDCGFRPINNIVDITNYVMLETGQPLHAFDFDKVAGKQLMVRPAAHGEELTTLDNKQFNLNPNFLVIADEQKPLDIAGIKGGKNAEISDKTKVILLTAANFEGANIYKTSKTLNLITDASARNAHNLSPALTAMALARASQLIIELGCGEPGRVVDVYQKKASRRSLKFSIDRFNKLTGLQLKEAEALTILQRLGFEITGLAGNKKIKVPILRDDIERFEDLAEEVVRLYGYNNIPAVAPHGALLASGYEEQAAFTKKIRHLLITFGLTEVYNDSFISKKDLESSAGEFFGLQAQPVANPVSADYEYLRPSLAPRLLKNIEDNFRFFDTVRLFEIGQVFIPEKTVLGIVIGSKKEPSILELKGIVDQLLEELGIVDRDYPELNFELALVHGRESLRIESDHQVIGYLGAVRGTGGRKAIAELDLEKILMLAEGEKEYEPMAKYPSIMRDLSILVPRHIRVNQILEIIDLAAPHYLDDVDVVDFYENDKELGENFKSITFRFVFLAEERTLTDAEADRELQKIATALINQLGVEVR